MLNPVEFYRDLGRKAAQARNQRDEAHAASHAEHFRRARDLEKAENRTKATEAYMESYRQARRGYMR